MENTKKVAWILTDHQIVVQYEGQTHHIGREEPRAIKLIEALKTKRYQDIPELILVSKALERSSGGAFTVEHGRVLVDGTEPPAALSNRIMAFFNEGLPYEPLVAFTRNLRQNPSFRAVQELYQFLETNNHPITDNGYFIAYKKVRPDFKDIHSGTFDNSVGNVVEMNRNEVDEDSNVTCSSGLHVSNWHYASTCFGSSTDPMLEVEVNPADVVAIPKDYNQSKMRVCKYRVLGVVEQELSTPLRITKPAVAPVSVDDSEVDDDYECENCGESVGFIDDFCSNCEDGEEYCEDCNTELTKYEKMEVSGLCDDCAYEKDMEKDDVEDKKAEVSEEEEDEYPYDDELDY